MPSLSPAHFGSAPNVQQHLHQVCHGNPPTSLTVQTRSALARRAGAPQGPALQAFPTPGREGALRPQRPRRGLAQGPSGSLLPSPVGSAGSSRAPMEEVTRDPSERNSGAYSQHDELMNRGAISQLQEFVQGAKLYPMPPNCSVLQWDYDTRTAGTSLLFRATVAFLLDGVPHHSAGAWKPSKKLAQRDAAERTLGLFVNRWGGLALADQLGPIQGQRAGPSSSSSSSRSASADVRLQLEQFCARLMPYVSLPLHWSHLWDGDGGELCQAFVEIRLLEVVHTFPGKPCQSTDAAYVDVARRVLWYLQAPGFEDVYEPDLDFVRAAAQTIPEPSAVWVREADSEGEEPQLPERKTTVSRVQNRLQQVCACQLEVGASPWYWSYVKDPKDQGWPPLLRATAHVPLVGRTFTGEWARGQREAERDTCARISEFLDQEFSRTKP